MKETIFEKNLKAMEKWYPDFADLIRQKKYKEDDTKVWTEQSQDGEVIFCIEREGKKLYLGGKRNAKKSVELWQERLGKIHKYAPKTVSSCSAACIKSSSIRMT